MTDTPPAPRLPLAGPYDAAMISRLPSGALWQWIMVWQAAQVKEGEPDQHFLCSYSDDAR